MDVANQVSNPEKRPSNINVAMEYEDMKRMKNNSGIVSPVSPETHLYQSNDGASPISPNSYVEKDNKIPGIE